MCCNCFGGGVGREDVVGKGEGRGLKEASGGVGGEGRGERLRRGEGAVRWGEESVVDWWELSVV